MGRWAGMAAGVLLALTTLAGCAPVLVYQTEVAVNPAGEVRRQTRMTIQADATMPGLRPKLSDYVVLPPAKDYGQFETVSNQAQMVGFFGGFDEIPGDFRLKPPKGGKEAGNRSYQRSFDVVLFRIVDYEERYEDGVDFYEGEAALEQFWAWLTPELEALLTAGWGREYDLSGFSQWLRGDGWRLVRRLYGMAWEIRRARRGGIAGESEEEELKRRLWLELGRFGVQTVDPRSPGAERINGERAEAWLNERLAEWFRPRQAGTPPPRLESFRSGAERARLQKAAVEVLQQRYGSLDAAVEQVRPWVPKIAGTFILADIAPVPTLAKTRLSVRWRLPGWVLHTNGYRDFDGTLRWDFTGRDAALAGYTLWARMVAPDPEAMRALELQGFPDRLMTMERYVTLLFQPDRRTTRSAVVAALRHSARTSSLSPLEALAGGGTPEAGVGDAEAAAELAAMLKRFQVRKGEAKNLPPVVLPPAAEDGDWR